MYGCLVQATFIAAHYALVHVDPCGKKSAHSVDVAREAGGHQWSEVVKSKLDISAGGNERRHTTGVPINKSLIVLISHRVAAWRGGMG